jgi:NADH:ubiquinone oxidoreductase subunit F (NADH-binding)
LKGRGAAGKDTGLEHSLVECDVDDTRVMVADKFEECGHQIVAQTPNFGL